MVVPRVLVVVAVVELRPFQKSQYYRLRFVLVLDIS
jgi:hypothetical protein